MAHRSHATAASHHRKTGPELILCGQPLAARHEPLESNSLSGRSRVAVNGLRASPDAMSGPSERHEQVRKSATRSSDASRFGEASLCLTRVLALRPSDERSIWTRLVLCRLGRSVLRVATPHANTARLCVSQPSLVHLLRANSFHSFNYATYAAN